MLSNIFWRLIGSAVGVQIINSTFHTGMEKYVGIEAIAVVVAWTGVEALLGRGRRQPPALAEQLVSSNLETRGLATARTPAQTNVKDDENESLARIRGMREIAEKDRLSLNGLLVTCQRFEESDETTYCFHYKNREKPFAVMAYHVAENDVQIKKMVFVREKSGIQEIVDSIIEKIFLIEQERRMIQPPKRFNLKDAPFENAREQNIHQSAENTDSVDQTGAELIDSLQQLSKNETYLDIEEVHAIANTYINDANKILQLYRTFDQEMKQRSQEQFIALLNQIREYKEHMKALAQNRQIHELKKVAAIIESRKNA